MPSTDMIFVIAIVVAFGAFAIVLGWTDFQNPQDRQATFQGD
jgi:hypothetical protein